MTIQNCIDIELWETIKKNYVSENYTGAIIDSIFKLTDTIRDKTGLEGDGSSLIGQAFGGENPRIKLNNLQTDSEKNAQKGIQEILRGIYTFVRNPRSHDSIQDTKTDADAVIVFINYLLCLIDKSKLNFEEEDFLKRVFDKYYVNSTEYSDLLVEEIPKRQRTDIAISVILKRNTGDIHSLRYFMGSLLNQLNDTNLSRVYSVASDELRTTERNKDIRYLIHILPGEHWGKIEKAVRLRTESILLSDFLGTTYDADSGEFFDKGALSTWITDEHFKNFSDLSKWTLSAIDMLQSDDIDKSKYVQTYFWKKILSANEANITYGLKSYFGSALKNGQQEVIDELEGIICWGENHPWWKVFENELRNYPNIKVCDWPF